MTEAEEIVCKPTIRYYWRLGLIITMLIGLGFYFFYDWKAGYYNVNAKRELLVALKAGECFKLGKDTAAGKAERELDDVMMISALAVNTTARKNEDSVFELAFQTGSNGAAAENAWDLMREARKWELNPQIDEAKIAELRDAFDRGVNGERWSAYSKGKRLDEKPDWHPQHKIDAQRSWGIGSFVIGGVLIVVMIVIMVNHLPRLIRVDGEAYYAPNGTRVPFASIYKVDKRKWENKGLATVYYRDEAETPRKTVIDYLKFPGSDPLLERVVENFDGELIERAPTEDEEDEEEDEGEDEGGEEAGAEAAEAGDGEPGKD